MDIAFGVLAPQRETARRFRRHKGGFPPVRVLSVEYDLHSRRWSAEFKWSTLFLTSSACWYSESLALDWTWIYLSIYCSLHWLNEGYIPLHESPTRLSHRSSYEVADLSFQELKGAYLQLVCWFYIIFMIFGALCRLGWRLTLARSVFVYSQGFVSLGMHYAYSRYREKIWSVTMYTWTSI